MGHTPMQLSSGVQTLTLPDGRLLDYDTGDGDQSLPTLLAHHGTPQAGTRDRSFDAAAAAVGVRVVTFSRAGYGGSSRRAGRTVADVADDARALLDHLGVDRCVTAGASGGGPHALATAALLPDRVAGVLSIAGVAPYDADDLDFLAGMGEDNVEEFGLALAGEAALRPFTDEHAAVLRHADAAGIVEDLGSILPEVDRRAISGEHGTVLGEDLAAGFAEALRLGTDGWVDDDLAFTRPWGFDLSAVTVPAFVWQGGADLMVPAAHGAWLVDRLPRVTAHLLPDHGHLSIEARPRRADDPRARGDARLRRGRGPGPSGLDGQDRAVRVEQHALGVRAQDQLADRRAAPQPDHDQLGVGGLGHAHEVLGGLEAPDELAHVVDDARGLELGPRRVELGARRQPGLPSGASARRSGPRLAAGPPRWPCRERPRPRAWARIPRRRSACRARYPGHTPGAPHPALRSVDDAPRAARLLRHPRPMGTEHAPWPGSVREPVAEPLARLLRLAVLDHVATERRREFPPAVHVGVPGLVRARLELVEGRLDHALRVDVLEAMVRRTRRPGPAPLVWLTRRGTDVTADVDLLWHAAARAAAGELGHPLPMVVVTRRTWHDPGTGVRRSWVRLREPR